MKTILVLAHAQSQHHEDKRVGGWYDTGLTALGREQAAKAANRISRIVGNSHTRLYSSDLKRAYETAEFVQRFLDTPIIPREELREYRYGVAEGRSQTWLDDRFLAPPKSGNRLDHEVCPGSDTRRRFATRIYRIMDEIIAEDQAVSIIVTHGFALTFVIACWIKMPIESVDYVNFKSSPAGITLLVEDDWLHNRGVKFMNCRDHLDTD